MNPNRSLVPSKLVRGLIISICKTNVILDADIARLYGVETKMLVRAVKRNLDRFPEDFMFQLTNEEFRILRHHLGTSRSWGGRRYRPYAFTEQGVAMLSSVLSSPRAIKVNIAIMRAFVLYRRELTTTGQIKSAVREHARRLETHDRLIARIIEAINQLQEPPRTEAIGFQLPKPEQES